MRRDFIANVSHELKTPLTVVTGFLETLQDMDLEPRQRTRYLRLMEEQARNMQRLVDDLLALSALESEHNPVQTRRSQWFRCCSSCPPMRRRSRKASMRSRWISARPRSSSATVTSSRVRSAIWSANAIRYTPQGGTITLALAGRRRGRAEHSPSRDTGIGIAPEHIPRLTERFYRVDRSRSRATGGTGLGLAIVKHVLLRHQAELDVDSQLGEGSTFSVLLPARARDAREAAAPTLRLVRSVDYQ